MKRILWVMLLCVLTLSAPVSDKMSKIPGYKSDFNTSIYAGYLDVTDPNRAPYYIFVQSVKGANNNDPLTLWLNGGPGCSSLLGFLQQIGPYYLQDGVDYKIGDYLTQNPYSWHKASNILFLESPAGVGFSYNLDTQFTYNDVITASDTMDALLDFFKKYPEYKSNKFFIAGESYAGKYIPDLAVLIDKYNLKQTAANKINFVGIMVGNGVMSFDTLDQSTIQFIIDKEMVDPEILPIYEKECKKDLYSDQCSVFLDKFDKDTQGVFFYDIYGYCYYNQESKQGMPGRLRLTQQSILKKLKRQHAKKKGSKNINNLKDVSCGFYDYGTYHYFNLHAVDYHAKFVGQVWNGPCADNVTYEIDPRGSIDSYKYLLNYSSTARKYQIFLYNGNADAVVPAIDTFKGLEILKVFRTSEYEPWFTGDQHSGFIQQYSGIQFVIFKGGSHQLPQSKRAESFQFFKNIVTTYKDKPQGQLTIEEN